MGENWFKRAALIGTLQPLVCHALSQMTTSKKFFKTMAMKIRTVYGGDFPSQMTSNLSDGLVF